MLFRDIYNGRLQQRGKSTRREGHPCLRFVHDFVSVVFDTRKSCGWRHFSTKRTAMRPLRGQNFLRGSQPLKYCFDLYSSRLYLEDIPFLQLQHHKERAIKVYLPLNPKGFPSCLVAFYIVSKHVLPGKAVFLAGLLPHLIVF